MLQAVKCSKFFNYELVDLKVRINLGLKEHHDMLTDISVLHSLVVVFLDNFNMLSVRTGAWKSESCAIV